MNALRYALPAAAAAAAALLLIPTETEAWVPLGGSLNLNQRDVRVFDNFTNAQANNNNQADDQFPGYTGAELAIWKAIAEWGSRPHGDGSGDPLQTTIGNGGANFDSSWQGNALVVGTTDQNICSRLGGGTATGTYAFVESPISNGWRMRFYTNNAVGNPWLWQDGPGDEDGGQDRPDLQGITTHEYGHALGLDHTTVPGSTMVASVSTEGSSNARSIGTDDILGVQGVYGVAAADKPTITNVQKFASNIEITGTFFDATNNEVWFTQAGQGGVGTPIKALNVPSTGGTFISVTIPAAAGSGDVLVRRPGAGGDDLSNAFPFDITLDSFPTFCNAADNATFFCPCGNMGNGEGGCDNAQGTGGVTTEVASFIPTGPAAALSCSGFPAMSSPTVIIIRSANLRPSAITFGDGRLCVDVPVVRLAATFASGGTSVHSFGHGAGTGEFHYQPWYRNTPASYCDPAAAFNLGSGVSLTWP